MTEPERPHLNLGEAPGRLRRARSGISRLWLATVVVLQATILGCLLLLLLLRSQPRGPAAAARPGADPEDLKSVAIQLEDKSLVGQAAEAWQKYLAAAPETDQRAAILYRIGRLYMQADQFDRAAAAFVRCEQAAGPQSDFRSRIGPHMVTCLRRLGLYGEVGRELSRRVQAGAGDLQQGKVLATLAGQPLTEADLDRMIERRVDQMLSMQDAAGNENARKALLRQFSRPEMRRQLFQELLRDELFTRRARELKLDRDEDFLEARRALEDQLLASRFQARQLDKIQATDVDLEAFYQANLSRYREPESMEALVLKLRAGEDADALLQRVQSADDFKTLARQRLAGSPKADAALPTETIVRGRTHPQLGNTDALFQLAAGAWTTQPHTNGDQRYLALVQRKSPARTPPLSEVKWRVEGDYLARKRQELSDKLFRELMTRYDVTIMPLEQTSGQAAPSSSKGQQKEAGP